VTFGRYTLLIPFELLSSKSNHLAPRLLLLLELHSSDAMNETGRKPRRRTRAPLARYSNYFEVGHNAYEFLIDFGQYQPEVSEVVLHTRIVAGPTLMKLLYDMVRDAICRYENENGPIPCPNDTQDPMEVLLRSLPDFERRALSARRRLPEKEPANPSKRSNPKR
jgi:hypothetical protein